MRVQVLFLFSILMVLSACSSEESVHTINWQLPQQYYQTTLKEATEALTTLKTIEDQQEAIQLFQRVRLNFKKAESYAAHLNPEVGTRVNGPALPIFKEDNLKVLDPIGLQAIEETLFEDFTNKSLLTYQIDRTEGYLKNLLRGIQERKLTADRYFIALHEQFLRVLSFGITHFDTPVSHWGFKESAVSLESIKTTVSLTIGNQLTAEQKPLYNNFMVYVDRNIDFLNKAGNFDDFDYYRYIRDYFNPMTKAWVVLRNATSSWQAPDTKAINLGALTFFDKDAFNTAFFVNPSTGIGSEKSILLGKKLFHDKRLSTSNSLACASCHDENKAFTDQLAKSLGNDGRALKRNAPTLINSIFNQSFFWDGRSGSIESQIREVFNAHQEFNRPMNELPQSILEDITYQPLFDEVYGRKPKSVNQLIKSLSQYVASLQSFDSKFDRNMRKEETTFTALEKKGLQLYMGKALCGSCHFIPLMNGTLPPYYRHTEKEVIGVPATASNRSLDTTDLGFYPFFEVDIHKGMFRTPTVRNSNRTAPYMHNGVYNTMEEVIDFYNKGGGAGLGLAVEHQTLPFDSLSLNAVEKKALIAFLATLDSQPEKIETEQEVLLTTLND